MIKGFDFNCNPFSSMGSLNKTVASGPYINAPLNVTRTGTSNPPQFNMNTDWVAPGDVQVGDIPQIQFDSTGTIYNGAAVATLSLDPPDFSGSGLPTLSAGTHNARVRYTRGALLGLWGLSADFTIAAVGGVKTYRGQFAEASGFDYIENSFDLGTAAADRFVVILISATSTGLGDPVITGITGISATPVAKLDNNYCAWLVAGIVSSGSGAITVRATMSSSGYVAKSISLWTVTGLASTTAVSPVVTGTLFAPPGGGVAAQTVVAGEFLFAGGARGDDDTFAGATQAPRQADAVASIFHFGDADWTLAASSGSFAIGADTSSNYTYVSARFA